MLRTDMDAPSQYSSPILALVVLLATVSPCRTFWASGDLLQVVRAGHRQAVESIASIHAKLRTETVSCTEGGAIRTTTRRGEWWQSGPKVRCKEVRNEPTGSPKVIRKGERVSVDVETQTESAFLDGLRTVIISRKESSSDPVTGAVLEVAQNRHHVSIDVWSLAGFLVRDSPRVALLDILDSRDWAVTVESLEEDGVTYLRGTCEGPDQNRVQAWLTPGQGFVPKRVLIGNGRGDFDAKQWLIAYESDAFRDLGGGVFFPSHTVMKVHKPGDTLGNPTGPVTNTFFEEVSINEPISDDTFRLKVPEGTNTTDKRIGKVYVMGSDGKPSPNEPIYELRTVPFGPSIAVEPAAKPLWQPWITAVLIVLGAGAAAIFIWRRTSRARGKPSGP
jgi:hypothetical protein